jgi:hypothetical protein
MAFEQAELRGAVMTAKATISKGRCTLTLALDAPLAIEAAAALGCKEKLFTSDGEVRPDLFSSASFYLPVEAVAVHLELDGIAKREVEAPEAEPSPITIEVSPEEIRVKVTLILRGAARRQLAVLGFAMEVGNAPLICRISAKEYRAAQNDFQAREE